MRLFLSSYRFGDHFDVFAELAGAPGPVAVIGNACDAWPQARAGAMTSELVPLRRLGYTPRELDLREYIGRPAELARELTQYPVVWVRGGNTFVLRAQFARSGADRVLPDLLAADTFLYAGYSAGACLLSPDLYGMETADDPDEVPPTCGIEPLWSGLGLIDRPIVPHIDSATDPTGAGSTLAARYRADGIAHWALTDADAVVHNAGETRCLTG
ncbi:Type 1 glutamine amidotransferase-like domain-containing protein [Nocardia sp. NPDC019395]|uniref:Type 1 glutamine amidotransferase-like domain-containing protein n=1 Tax=Nocardia sp. NPDC019395 TaxID=3154686 RepID=UPI0033C740C9